MAKWGDTGRGGCREEEAGDAMHEGGGGQWTAPPNPNDDTRELGHTDQKAQVTSQPPGQLQHLVLPPQ
ncbi:hypothetical protein BaRGS_00031494 [Batillaria attramentaria]|uniref:Uncharacterized protein n=1 Tax=Batillaria attramentaria TaxID=370345 RepID=A0ABD0JQF9_9CAEN